nr:hypothetical protein [Tanacetum cinerariifolium]
MIRRYRFRLVEFDYGFCARSYRKLKCRWPLNMSEKIITVIEADIGNLACSHFNIGDSYANQPLDTSSITTFVPTKLQDPHFNNLDQCKLEKGNVTFTEGGIQKPLQK